MEKKKINKEVKEIINLSNGAKLFLYPATKPNQEGAILITPNSASYYAKSDKYGGKARGHIDNFCIDLSKKHDTYYLVLPGQNPWSRKKERYSWNASTSATGEAINYIMSKKELAGIIGFCTGGAIAANECMNMQEPPKIILYNAAPEVPWNTAEGQKAFSKKYPNVRLDNENMYNDPMPGSIIVNYQGPMLQIITGNSDYSIKRQSKMANIRPDIPCVIFETLSDAPQKELSEYKLFLKAIFLFLEKE